MAIAVDVDIVMNDSSFISQHESTSIPIILRKDWAKSQNEIKQGRVKQKGYAKSKIMIKYFLKRLKNDFCWKQRMLY